MGDLIRNMIFNANKWNRRDCIWNGDITKIRVNGLRDRIGRADSTMGFRHGDINKSRSTSIVVHWEYLIWKGMNGPRPGEWMRLSRRITTVVPTWGVIRRMRMPRLSITNFPLVPI
jgi:hypothetical protein